MTTDAEVIAAINAIRHAAVAADGTLADTAAEAKAARDLAATYLQDPEFVAALYRLSQQTGGNVNLNESTGDREIKPSEVVAWAETFNTDPRHDVTLDEVRNDSPRHLDAARELKPRICGCPHS